MLGRCISGVCRSRDEAFKIGTEIAREVTASNPPPVTLKFEKVYHPCVLLTKKRYVGYMYESPSQVGLQHVCSTHAPLAFTPHLTKNCLLCCVALCGPLELCLFLRRVECTVKHIDADFRPAGYKETPACGPNVVPK